MSLREVSCFKTERLAKVPGRADVIVQLVQSMMASINIHINIDIHIHIDIDIHIYI